MNSEDAVKAYKAGEVAGGRGYLYAPSCYQSLEETLNHHSLECQDEVRLKCLKS